MKNYEPTIEYLRSWAMDEENIPDQDFDLKVVSTVELDVLLKLANEDLPNRKFFLACLYLISGNCVRNRIDYEAIYELKKAICCMDGGFQDVKLWGDRSIELFNEPDSFNYELWCHGGFAYQRS